MGGGVAVRRMTSEERKGLIADVATRLFAHHGFAGVTTRQIAREAGVNEALLYQHFPNKEALYTEMITRKIAAEKRNFDLSILEGDDDREILRCVASWFLGNIGGDKTFLRLMLFSALEDHRLSTMFFQSRMSGIGMSLMKYLENRMRQGIFRAIKPRIAIKAFLGMIMHHMMTAELFSLPKAMHVSRREVVDEFVDIFLEGMRKR
jgi:AcrR family transcriptional regulator